MATQRTSKEPDATAGEQPKKAAASTVEDTQRAIEEAYPKFAATLVEANLEAERQAGEALRRYLDAVRSAIEDGRKEIDELVRSATKRSADAQQKQDEAQRNYASAMQPSADETKAAVDAQTALNHAVQATQVEAQHRADAAMKQHAAAQLEAQDRASTALREYAAALQKAPQDAASAAQAYQRYTATLEEIGKETQKRSEEAWRAYQASQLDGQQQAADAVRKYLGALQGISSAPERSAEGAQKIAATITDAAADATRMGEEGMRRYVEAQSQIRRRADEAQRAYAAALGEIRTEAQKRQIETYRGYLVAMQRAWSQLNVDALLAGMQT
jgi:hypothetical protein